MVKKSTRRDSDGLPKLPPTDPSSTTRRKPVAAVVPHKHNYDQSHGPYLSSSSRTASSLSDSQYHDQFGMSSSSQSTSFQPSNSISSQSTTRGGETTLSTTSTVRKLYYTSPRLELDDRQIFPTSPVKQKSLQNADDRWKYVSQQAGSHKQDSTVLHVSRRHSRTTPEVLKAGVPPQVANRIQKLHLGLLEQAEDMLPEWLDVISQKFPQLEHLYFTGEDDDHSNNNNKKEIKNNKSHKSPHEFQTNRLRRLYILYRLPQLQSIDGIPVTKSERRLARPDDPNGQRVAKGDWCPVGGEKEECEEEGIEVPANDVPITPNTYKQRKAAKGIREFVQRQDDDDDEEEDENDVHNHGEADENGEAKGLIQMTEEGYELDANLAEAIQQQKLTRSPYPPPRKQTLNNDTHGNQAATGDKRQRPEKPEMTSSKSNNKQHNKSKQKQRDSPNTYSREGNNDYRLDHNRTLEYVACDSTVTSEYGYAHWSGACLAPFQACTAKTRQKTKEALTAARKSKPLRQDKHAFDSDGSTTQPTHHGNDYYNRHRNNNNHPNRQKQPQHDVPPIEEIYGPSATAKSSKYSSLIDETVQEDEVKHRRKLFRDSTASQGVSTAPSSRRSHKYSRLLIEVEDEQRGQSSNSSAGSAQVSPDQHRREQSKQLPKQSEDKKRITPVLPALDDDEVGTMTGLSIQVAHGANAGMSVATIPSVLRREAEKLQKSQKKQNTDGSNANLSSRRKMTGITIDVPPHTPSDAQKEPRGNVKQAPGSPKQSSPKQESKTAHKQMHKVNGAKSPKKLGQARDILAVDTETFEEMEDAELVDMVMSKLGGNRGGLDVKQPVNPSLQLPHLTATPVVANTGKSNQRNSRRHSPGGAIVTSEAKKASKGTKKQKMEVKMKPEAPSASSTSSESSGNGNTNSSARSKENLNDLESRINSLIAGTNKLKGHSSTLSDRDKMIMAETVSKLDQNLKNIRRQQNSPDQRGTPTRSRRRQQRVKKNKVPLPSSDLTESSPLSKLESSMGQLFASIMAQMSPSRRAIPSSSSAKKINHPKKEKLKDGFFSKETEKTLNKLNCGGKATDDDSTLFVVEIQQQDVADSITNVDFRPEKKTISDAPSFINLVASSQASSETSNHEYTYLRAQRTSSNPHSASKDGASHVPKNSGPPSLPSLSHETQVQNPQPAGVKSQQRDNEKDPTIIDLTDKSTVVTFNPGVAHLHCDSGKQQNLEVEMQCPIFHQTEHHNIQPVQPHTLNNDQQIQHDDSHAPPKQNCQFPYMEKLQVSQQQQVLRLQGQQLQEMQEAAAQSKSQIQLQLEQRLQGLNGADDSAETVVDTGGNGSRGGVITQQESKLGMVLKLETINENAAVDEEIDGECVAAAAAGAAAGAEAGVDGDDENDTENDTDYPSEFIPTNNAVTGELNGLECHLRLPREIVTQTDASRIAAILQGLTGTNDEYSASNDGQEQQSPGYPPPITDADSYPSEVMVTSDSEASVTGDKEPGFMASLLTGKQQSSTISFASRKESLMGKQTIQEESLRTPLGTHLPKEIMAMVYDAMTRDSQDSAPLSDSPSPEKMTRPAHQLPREILAVLEERQGRNPCSSEEARAMLPEEVCLMIDEAYGLMPDPSQYKYLAEKAPDSPSSANRFPASLPKEVSAFQEQDHTFNGTYGSDLLQRPSNQQISPSSQSGQQRLRYMKSNPRFPKPFGSVNSSAKAICQPETRLDDPPSMSRLSGMNDTSLFNFAGSERFDNAQSQDSQEIPHPSSLPSHVVVEYDGAPTKAATSASPNKKVPPSMSLTSPFPMQFRQRAGQRQESTSAWTDAAAVDSSATGTQVPNVDDSLPNRCSNTLSEPSFSVKQITLEQRQTGRKKIESPSSSVRNLASPRLQSRAQNSELPPPCPTSTRRLISSISPRSEKLMKSFSRWRDQRSARSNSIMDGVDDEEEEDEYYDSYQDGEEAPYNE